MITSKDFNLDIQGVLPVEVNGETIVLVIIESVPMFPLMSLSKLFNIDHTKLLKIVESDKIPHKPLRDIVKVKDVWYIAYYFNPAQVTNLVKEISLSHTKDKQQEIYENLINILSIVSQELKKQLSNS